MRLPRYDLGIQTLVQDEGPVVLAFRQAQGIRDRQRPLVRRQARLNVMADQGLGLQAHACHREKRQNKPSKGHGLFPGVIQ